jgi:hypothetical protein
LVALYALGNQMALCGVATNQDLSTLNKKEHLLGQPNQTANFLTSFTRLDPFGNTFLDSRPSKSELCSSVGFSNSSMAKPKGFMQGFKDRILS